METIIKKVDYYNKRMDIYFKNEYTYIFKILLIIFFTILFINLIHKNINSRSKFTEIDFVYVGEGSGVVIKTKKGKNILIDAGEGFGKRYEHGLKTFIPYILNTKSKKIHSMYLSHLDSDHAGGGIYVLKYLNSKNIFIPNIDKKVLDEDKIYKELRNLSNKKRAKIKQISRGFNEQIDEVNIEVLWPDKNYLISKSRLNNNSIVMMVNIYGVKILFTGDIEKEAEIELVKRYKNNLKADILVAPHHGSKTSSSEEFLKYVNPQYAICSAGKDNIFKHPHDKIIERYKKHNIKFLRTDEMGRIKLKIYKDRLKIDCFKAP